MAYVVSESVFNAKAGEGNVFMVSQVFLTVANNAIVWLRHVSGASLHLHSIVEINTVGQWRFTSYSGTTYSAPGTVMSGINRRSDAPNQVLQSTFYHTPTIDVLGTPRLDFMFGAGTNPSRADTAVGGDKLESVFAPNADVLIGLQNLSGASQYLSVIFNVHEQKGG